ncbi:hypothetical protein Y919_04150 [Caloranaerobacter azorensis H53214]|uniref:RNA 2',3'-cyclic phosphodiesterase n=1 Tax=Caloranaerobacter azorensis H53214 TaxID=1156417 RepID=A0A096CW42_9FIRM|nr:RNA 2',3'-cyclic phosphodiesterase [Caloranaerobacter azorensis]KGG80789.1 hypothetical protein Y919_04150 [Caloranaerobacter azorensis H53214]
MRLFIALSFDKELKERIAKIQKKVKINSSKGRWVYFDNFHLTLKFLGSVDKNYIDDINKSLEKIASDFTEIKLKLDKLDYFPGKGMMRVVWLGVSGEVEKVKQMKLAVDKEMIKYGFAKEKRKYTPHITLARDVVFESRKYYIDDLIEKDLEYSFTLKNLTLMNSELIDGRRIYTPVGNFRLD